MYDFHYNFIKKNFEAELLFTDTDNLTYEIKSENAYEEILSGTICLPLVIIQKIQSFQMTLIKKLLAKYIGLKSKMYSIKKNDGEKQNTAKGVNVATEVDKFKDVLFNEKIIRPKMKRIQSKKHKLGTYEIDKISLSCFDDTRYVLDDGIYTLDYFYKDSATNCKEIKKDCDKKDSDKKDCDN